MKKVLTFKFLAKSLFWVFLFFLLLQHSFSYLDPDLGWHLESGKRTYLTGQATATNDHNFSFPSNTWLDHEWLADLGMYLAYDKIGYPAINIFFVLIVLMSVFILYKQSGSNKPQWPAFLLLTFGTIAAAPHFGVRIQEFTFLFTILIFALLLKYQKSLNWKYLIPIPVIIWLWANLHAGFLLGLIMLVIFGLIKIIKIIWPKISQEKKINTKGLIILILIGIISFGLTLINPYGFKLYSFLFGYRDTFFLTYISEWLPQWDFPYQYWQLSYIAILSITLWQVFKNKLKKYSLFEIVLILFLLITAIKSRRNFPLLLAASLPLLIKETTLALYPKQSKIIMNTFLKICLIFSLIFLSTSQIITTKMVNNPFRQNDVDYPEKALDWLKSQDELQNKRTFNEFGWGGYIIWQYPEAKIFIDGRQPQAEMTDVSGLEEYYRFYNDNQAEEKLLEHKIDLVLLKNNSNKEKGQETIWKRFFIFNYKSIKKHESENELLTYLQNSLDWTLIYEDELTVIYKK